MLSQRIADYQISAYMYVYIQNIYEYAYVFIYICKYEDVIWYEWKGLAPGRRFPTALQPQKIKSQNKKTVKLNNHFLIIICS
jgi:hypothetical protein